MVLKRLEFTDLIAAIQNKIETKTSKRCYDSVPDNAQSPFYFVEIVAQRPANNKTMFREIYTAWVHCIAAAEDNGSSIGVYDLINKVQEAMTEEVTLPDPFILLSQTDGGLQALNTDETGEKHAVCAFDFMVCYGFMAKI